MKDIQVGECTDTHTHCMNVHIYRHAHAHNTDVSPSVVTAGCASVFFTLLSPSGPSFPVATDYFEWSIQWYEKSILQNKMWAWRRAENDNAKNSCSLSHVSLVSAHMFDGGSTGRRQILAKSTKLKNRMVKGKPNKNKYSLQILMSHISIIALQGCYSFLPFLFWDKSINLLFYEQTPIGSYSLYTHCVRYLACNYISEISY